MADGIGPQISALEQSFLVSQGLEPKKTEEALKARAAQVGALADKTKETREKEGESNESAPVVSDELVKPEETQKGGRGLKISNFEDGRTQTASPNGVIRENRPNGSFFFSFPDGYVINHSPEGKTGAVDPNTGKSYPVRVIEKNTSSGPVQIYSFTDSIGRTHKVNGKTLEYQIEKPMKHILVEVYERKHDRLQEAINGAPPRDKARLLQLLDESAEFLKFRTGLRHGTPEYVGELNSTLSTRIFSNYNTGHLKDRTLYEAAARFGVAQKDLVGGGVSEMSEKFATPLEVSF